MRAMNTGQRVAALALLLLLFGIAARAASFTTIQVNPKEPSLQSLLDGTYGAGNYTRISDDLDQQWDVSALLSSVAIVHVSAANEQLGACAVCDGSDDFLLGPAVVKGGPLPLSLFSGALPFAAPTFSWFDAAFGAPQVGKVYSDTSLNANATDHMVSFAIDGQPGAYILAFEDWLSTYSGGASDRDFNDFVVEVRFESSPELVENPEPATVTLLGGALLALGLATRRKRR